MLAAVFRSELKGVFTLNMHGTCKEDSAATQQEVLQVHGNCKEPLETRIVSDDHSRYPEVVAFCQVLIANILLKL